MSCLTLCDPMDCSPPGSSVHGISQARILEWVAIFFFQGIFPTQGSNSCLLHWQADSLPLNHQGSPRKLDTHMKICKHDKLAVISLHFPYPRIWGLTLWPPQVDANREDTGFALLTEETTEKSMVTKPLKFTTCFHWRLRGMFCKFCHS